MFAGFRNFLLRGNVMDLAVGVIVGAAFAGVVDALAADIIMPIVGAVAGEPDFSAIMVGPVRLGSFLNAVLAFVLKAAGLYYLIVLPYMRFSRRHAVTPTPEPARDVVLLGEIRDLLREREVGPPLPH